MACQDSPVFTGEVSITASQLLSVLAAQTFSYAAMNSTKFAPWGFDKVLMNVSGASSTQLFAVSLKELGKLVNINGVDDYLQGSFSFNATTQSTFTYQSTAVSFLSVPGKIPSQDSTLTLPGPFDNALDSVVSATGSLRYSGTLEYLPVINITAIGGLAVSMSFPISVGLTMPYDSAALITKFPNTNLHIPLPNVFVPKSALSFGPVQTGTQSQSKVTIQNTGELGGLILMTSSSDPQFLVGSSGTMIPPNDAYDLTVSFLPANPGAQSATITVKTNDPDSPTQTFTVTGTGVGEPLADAGIDAPLEGEAPSGDANAQESGAKCIPDALLVCSCRDSGFPLGQQMCGPDGTPTGPCYGCYPDEAGPAPHPDASSDASADASASPGAGGGGNSDGGCRTRPGAPGSAAHALLAALLLALTRRLRRFRV